MRKERLTYYFSVEGETEKWYLDWLQNVINATPEAKCIVKLDSKIVVYNGGRSAHHNPVAVRI